MYTPAKERYEMMVYNRCGGGFSEEELTEIDRISKSCWYWK